MLDKNLNFKPVNGEAPVAPDGKMESPQPSGLAEGPPSSKKKRPRKPRSQTNRENYLKRAARDMPVKIWLAPEAFEVFESGRKAKRMSRSQYGNELFGKGADGQNPEGGLDGIGSAKGHPDLGSLAEQDNRPGSAAAAALQDCDKKKLLHLSRYSKAGGRQLSESEILHSLVEGVSPEMLVWMIRISIQQDQSLVDVFRTQLSLARAEHFKGGAVATKVRQS